RASWSFGSLLGRFVGLRLRVRLRRGVSVERVLHAFEGFGRALDATLGGFALLALGLGRALDLLLLAIGLDDGVAAAGIDGRGAGASGGESKELERSARGH